MTGAITFDTNSLQTYDKATDVGILTNSINHASIPEKIATLYQVASANKSAIPSVTYPSKSISVSGVIKGSSQSDLDSRLDTFKGYFRGKEKNLDINHAGSTRRYIATVNTLSVPEQAGALLWAPFTIEFICTDPFGRDITATEIADVSNHTTASYNMAPTIGGTAPSQLPIFTIAINSITGSGDFISISNDDNDQSIVIFGQSIANGDVIIIDCEEREVTINGTEVDYSGIFLELDPGGRSLTLTDGFDTRDIDILAEYYKRYF